MNLTELQLELRGIEDKLESLHMEIEKMKPKTDDEKRSDFEKITKLASKYPIEPLWDMVLGEISEAQRTEMVKGLAYICLCDESELNPRLLYLCRLAKGLGLNVTAEEIYKSGLEFEVRDIDQLCENLKYHKYMFLAEAMAFANLSGTASADILSVIIDMAVEMGCCKEEIKILAEIAKCRLADDIDTIRKMLSKLGKYVPEEILAKKRDCVYSYRDTATGQNDTVLGVEKIIQKKVEMGDYVEDGQEIAECEWSDGNFKLRKGVALSSQSGIVWYVETEWIFGISQYKFYVVSCFDNYEAVKNWVLNRA